MDMQAILKAAHKHSSKHKQELVESNVIGCFYCCRFVKYEDIEEWIDNQSTAICPLCSIDSLIGDASGITIDHDFLLEMNQEWF